MNMSKNTNNKTNNNQKGKQKPLTKAQGEHIQKLFKALEQRTTIKVKYVREV